MYAPATNEGSRLLAHEVAHVVQQSSGKEPSISAKSSRGVKIGAPDDSLEAEAETKAGEFMGGAQPETSDEEPFKRRKSPQAVQRFIQRQPSPDSPPPVTPDTPASSLQQEGVGPRVMRKGPVLPRSLDSTLVPSTLSLAELDQEIDALRDWLQAQQVGTEETNRLFRALETMQAEKEARAAGSSFGVPPITPPSSPPLPPLRQAPTSTPENLPPPTTTLAGPLPSGRLSLEPSEPTRQRLEQLIRQGGKMPEGTRVIGAAIIEVEGYSGPRELRAVSSMQTDDLGHAAPVAHAETPTTRTLSAARSIGGASIRREFPFSHINDAEIKLFQKIADNLPANARGRISFLTMRSRQGGQILEPIPACSSCTNATFQLAGAFRGVQVASYAATHPTTGLDLGLALGQTLPPATGGAVVRPGEGGGTPSGQTWATVGETRAEIGTPDVRGLNVGGPSPRGEAKGAGIMLAFMGANFILNIINDYVQQTRAKQALDAIEPGLRSQRQQHPELGVLLVFYYTQYQTPDESLIRPGAAFGSVTFYTGRTRDEARDAWRATPTIRAGVGPNTEEFTQQIWIQLVIPPSVRDIRTPFPSVALATFADGQSVLQDVEWGGITGFDDEGTSRLSLGQQSPRFLILRVPNKLHFFNGGIRVDVDIPITQRGAQSGGAIPAVNLDPTIPGFNVSAACVFPADDATDLLFAAAIATHDNLGQLDIYTNFGKVRWVRPEHVKVLQTI
jgi:hypothetical protein